MPNTASAKKALRVSHRRQKVNARVTKEFKDLRKELKMELHSGSKKDQQAELAKVYSKVDLAVKKQVIHKNTGARFKSRLSAEVKKSAHKTK
jgi:small subunit ribosomal protein S20